MIDRDLIRAIRGDIDTALTAIAEKHGLARIRCGNATFSRDGVSGEIKLGLMTKESAGSPRLDRAAKALDMFRKYHPSIDFDAAYRCRTKPGTWRITGYNTKAKAYPFIITCVEGGAGMLKASEEQIKTFFRAI